MRLINRLGYCLLATIPVVALAAQHGFKTVAIELARAMDDRAALPGH